MSALLPALGAFCAGLGLDGQPQALPVVLDFERTGRLHLEEDASGSLVVYLARHVPAWREGVALAALRAVHPDRGLPHAVQAGFHGEETLVLLARLPAEQVDTPALDGLLGLLARLADEAEAAAP
jgi:type III secretion system chaperone SycN